MTKYRCIYVTIWTDPTFECYSEKEKLMFIFLFSNPYTSESGIYPLTIKTIAQGIGLESTEVKHILKSRKLRNISYDFKNQVVFVHNFIKCHGKGCIFWNCLLKDYKRFKTSLWDQFEKLYPGLLAKAKEEVKKHKQKRKAKANSISNSTTNSNAIGDPIGDSSEDTGEDTFDEFLEKVDKIIERSS